MNVFIAGGSGAIGVPLIRELVASGHQVSASTRSAANAAKLQGLGAAPVIVDALDADALKRAVGAVRPTHVVHELTALPKGGPKSARDLETAFRDVLGMSHREARRAAGAAWRALGSEPEPKSELSTLLRASAAKFSQ